MPFDIFAGLRVLDFSRVLAGPYATRLLADYGAEVLKLQTRKTAVGAEANREAYFAAWNRNKRGIVLDMDQPGARDAVLELARVCDIVVENFAPRVLDNWGLDYESLQRQNAGIILLRMSAMGQTGPWRNRVAFGPTIHALSGLIHFTSAASPPLNPGFAYADVVAGLYGALAVSAAVYSRERTGRGECIELSEYEAMASLLGPALVGLQAGATGDWLRTELAEPVPAAPYGCFRCRDADRWCAIAVFADRQWLALCEVLELGDARDDPRFATHASRRQHASELQAKVQEKALALAAGELSELLQRRGVPAALVQDARDLACDPQLLQRGFFLQIPDAVRGKLVGDRGAIRLGDVPSPAWKSAPMLGQDVDYVFGTLLKWSPEKIADHRARGVIA
jgi:crotonobetainyl-CoA:carnitine CoA-transferase CaiB-like acyl-CoA transferase